MNPPYKENCLESTKTDFFKVLKLNKGAGSFTAQLEKKTVSEKH